MKIQCDLSKDKDGRYLVSFGWDFFINLTSIASKMSASQPARIAAWAEKMLKGGETTYYGVFVEQDDKRPVIVARYENLATGFANHSITTVKWSVRPIVLSNALLE